MFFNLSQFPSLRNKKIIALGESIHGNGDLHNVAGELIISSVEQFGTRTILWEAPWGIVEKLNSRLQHGQKSPIRPEDLRELYAIWRSEEVLRLLEWIRQFNQEIPRSTKPVMLVGVDIRMPFYELQELSNWLNTKGGEKSLPTYLGNFPFDLSLEKIRQLKLRQS